MRFRTLRHPETWSGFALEMSARHRPSATASGPLSWGLPDDSPIRVRWPRSYDWIHAGKWMGAVADALRQLADTDDAEIPQNFRHIVVAEVEHSGERRRIAIDYGDSMEVSLACAEDVEVYFKMQFRSGGYDAAHVVPGGFVANGGELALYVPHVRAVRDQRRFRYDVYGTFSPGYASAVRSDAVRALTQQTRFGYEGGFEINRYSVHLLKTAKSKVVVDLPGNGPFCFRLVDYLAVGSAIVALPHEARMHVPLADAGVTYLAGGPSALVDEAASLLQDDQRRERMAAAARTYYDRYLHPRQLAAYYLHTTLNLTT